MHLEHCRDSYRISTDPNLVDVDAVHAYLTRSYWAEGISKDIVAKAIQDSLCFSLFEGRTQIGFARTVTDRATFAYLCDVYVLEEYRACGLGKWLIEVVLSHPELRGLRRFVLATRNAHGLYEPFGFKPLAKPEIYMEIVHPNIYRGGLLTAGLGRSKCIGASWGVAARPTSPVPKGLNILQASYLLVWLVSSVVALMLVATL